MNEVAYYNRTQKQDATAGHISRTQYGQASSDKKNGKMSKAIQTYHSRVNCTLERGTNLREW